MVDGGGGAVRRQLCLRRQGGDKRLRLGDERLKRGDALGEALALVPVVSFFLFFTALFAFALGSIGSRRGEQH